MCRTLNGEHPEHDAIKMRLPNRDLEVKVGKNSGNLGNSFSCGGRITKETSGRVVYKERIKFRLAWWKLFKRASSLDALDMETYKILRVSSD